MNRSRRLLRAGVILISVALVGVTVAGAADAQFGSYNRNLEAASAAIPAQAGDSLNDVSMHVEHPSGRTLRASAVATSSLTCDGCHANAVTLQVIYSRGVRALQADNVAAAWSSCTGCQGSALSLQVVIARRAGTVVAGNRSLAVNATCVNCLTAAAAVQIVVISNSQRELSKQALAQIVALRDQLNAQLQAQITPAPPAPAAAQSARLLPLAAPMVKNSLAAGVGQIQKVLLTDLHATLGSQDIQLRTG
ncbi:hypothetical protein ACSMXN_01745 [Jatrophihabitans sp. DSM 45814]